MEMLYLLAGVSLSFLLGSMNLTTSSIVPHLSDEKTKFKRTEATSKTMA